MVIRSLAALRLLYLGTWVVHNFSSHNRLLTSFCYPSKVNKSMFISVNHSQLGPKPPCACMQRKFTEGLNALRQYFVTENGTRRDLSLPFYVHGRCKIEHPTDLSWYQLLDNLGAIMVLYKIFYDVLSFGSNAFMGQAHAVEQTTHLDLTICACHHINMWLFVRRWLTNSQTHSIKNETGKNPLLQCFGRTQDRMVY